MKALELPTIPPLTDDLLHTSDGTDQHADLASPCHLCCCRLKVYLVQLHGEEGLLRLLHRAVPD
jgi:hypothetical protein